VATGLTQKVVIPSSVNPLSISGVGDELIRAVEQTHNAKTIILNSTV
jgi:hypothetical protein